MAKEGQQQYDFDMKAWDNLSPDHMTQRRNESHVYDVHQMFAWAYTAAVKADAIKARETEAVAKKAKEPQIAQAE